MPGNTAGMEDSVKRELGTGAIIRGRYTYDI